MSDGLKRLHMIADALITIMNQVAVFAGLRCSGAGPGGSGGCCWRCQWVDDCQCLALERVDEDSAARDNDDQHQRGADSAGHV